MAVDLGTVGPPSLGVQPYPGYGWTPQLGGSSRTRVRLDTPNYQNLKDASTKNWVRLDPPGYGWTPQVGGSSRTRVRLDPPSLGGPAVPGVLFWLYVMCLSGGGGCCWTTKAHRKDMISGKQAKAEG